MKGYFWQHVNTVFIDKFIPVVRYNGFEIDNILQQIMTGTGDYIYTAVFKFTEEELEQITVNKLQS